MDHDNCEGICECACFESEASILGLPDWLREKVGGVAPVLFGKRAKYTLEFWHEIVGLPKHGCLPEDVPTSIVPSSEIYELFNCSAESSKKLSISLAKDQAQARKYADWHNKVYCCQPYDGEFCLCFVRACVAHFEGRMHVNWARAACEHHERIQEQAKKDSLGVHVPTPALEEQLLALRKLVVDIALHPVNFTQSNLPFSNDSNQVGLLKFQADRSMGSADAQCNERSEKEVQVQSESLQEFKIVTPRPLQESDDDVVPDLALSQNIVQTETEELLATREGDILLFEPGEDKEEASLLKRGKEPMDSQSTPLSLDAVNIQPHSVYGNRHAELCSFGTIMAPEDTTCNQHGHHQECVDSEEAPTVMDEQVDVSVIETEGEDSARDGCAPRKCLHRQSAALDAMRSQVLLYREINEEPAGKFFFAKPPGKPNATSMLVSQTFREMKEESEISCSVNPTWRAHDHPKGTPHTSLDFEDQCETAFGTKPLGRTHDHPSVASPTNRGGKPVKTGPRIGISIHIRKPEQTSILSQKENIKNNTRSIGIKQEEVENTGIKAECVTEQAEKSLELPNKDVESSPMQITTVSHEELPVSHPESTRSDSKRKQEGSDRVTDKDMQSAISSINKVAYEEVPAAPSQSICWDCRSKLPIVDLSESNSSREGKKGVDDEAAEILDSQRVCSDCRTKQQRINCESTGEVVSTLENSKVDHKQVPLFDLEDMCWCCNTKRESSTHVREKGTSSLEDKIKIVSHAVPAMNEETMCWECKSKQANLEAQLRLRKAGCFQKETTNAFSIRIPPLHLEKMCALDCTTIREAQAIDAMSSQLDSSRVEMTARSGCSTRRALHYLVEPLQEFSSELRNNSSDDRVQIGKVITKTDNTAVCKESADGILRKQDNEAERGAETLDSHDKQGESKSVLDKEMQQCAEIVRIRQICSDVARVGTANIEATDDEESFDMDPMPSKKCEHAEFVLEKKKKALALEKATVEDLIHKGDAQHALNQQLTAIFKKKLAAYDSLRAEVQELAVKILEDECAPDLRKHKQEREKLVASLQTELAGVHKIHRDVQEQLDMSNCLLVEALMNVDNLQLETEKAERELARLVEEEGLSNRLTFMSSNCEVPPNQRKSAGMHSTSDDELELSKAMKTMVQIQQNRGKKTVQQLEKTTEQQTPSDEPFDFPSLLYQASHGFTSNDIDGCFKSYKEVHTHRIIDHDVPPLVISSGRIGAVEEVKGKPTLMVSTKPVEEPCSCNSIPRTDFCKGEPKPVAREIGKEPCACNKPRDKLYRSVCPQTRESADDDALLCLQTSVEINNMEPELMFPKQCVSKEEEEASYNKCRDYVSPINFTPTLGGCTIRDTCGKQMLNYETCSIHGIDLDILMTTPPKKVSSKKPMTYRTHYKIYCEPNKEGSPMRLKHGYTKLRPPPHHVARILSREQQVFEKYKALGKAKKAHEHLNEFDANTICAKEKARLLSKSRCIRVKDEELHRMIDDIMIIKSEKGLLKILRGA